MPSLRYREDDRVNDRYRIDRVLGGGGYSVVYEAYDELLDETIALKVFAPNYGFDPVRREIQALRRLDHPNVVQLIDVGKIESDPPQWFMKLGLLPGRTLREVLRQTTLVPSSPDVHLIGQQLLSALCALHPDAARIADLSARETLDQDEFNELQALRASGLVHRDIKPENILFAGESIVLIDFNLATPVGSMIETRSHTPEYSPPMLGVAEWDVHADLYATAVTLFELMEGSRPDDVRSDDANSSTQSSDVPQGFAEFIQRARSRGDGGFASAR